MNTMKFSPGVKAIKQDNVNGERGMGGGGGASTRGFESQLGHLLIV